MYTEVTTLNLLSTSFGVVTASWSYSNPIDGKLAATLVGAFVAAIFRANENGSITDDDSACSRLGIKSTDKTPPPPPLGDASQLAKVVDVS